jgi:hypothetical protein
LSIVTTYKSEENVEDRALKRVYGFGCRVQHPSNRLPHK